MLNQCRPSRGCLAAGLWTATLLLPTLASAEDPGLADLKARTEALEKSNRELFERLAQQRAAAAGQINAGPKDAPPSLDAKTVDNIVGDMLKKKDEEKKKKDDEKKAEEDAKKAEEDARKKDEEARKKAEGYEVGSALGMTANWTPLGVVFSTQNKDFQFHVGGRIDYDNLWWKQPPFLQGAAPGTGVNTAAPFPGTGPISGPAFGARQFAGPVRPPLSTNVGTTGEGVLEDGTFFRRARIQADGTAYQVMEWAIEYDFQNTNTFIFDTTFVGLRDIPFIGTLRAGAIHTPQGLENYPNSKFTPTMEQSPLFDPFFYQICMGIYATNSILCQRMTWHYMFGRLPNSIPVNPVDIGSGDYAHTFRLTGLPLYEDDGRYLIHLGLSYQYRVGQLDTTTSSAAGSGAGLPGTPLSPGAPPLFPGNVRVVRFRDRPSLRDAVGLGTLGEGDAGRFIDTGNIVAPGVNTTGGELMAYMGPFWLQCEGVWANVPNAIYPPGTAAASAATATSPALPARVPVQYERGTLNYWGYYLMAGYFLTGDNRGYDRRFGLYDRVRPNENFFLVRGDDGRPKFGTGAWEVLYRWSFVDLDSRGADGGRLGEHTFGLNWHLNPNAKIMLNYIIDQRNFNSLVPTFAPTGPQLTNSNVRTGQTEGLGLRFHLDF